VKRSAPVKKHIISPTGKKQAEIVLFSPGAFAWSHGDALVERLRVQPKPKRKLPAIELTNILSRRWLAFFVPMVEMRDTVWAGERASIVKGMVEDTKNYR
jgi:hypothetical protein